MTVKRYTLGTERRNNIGQPAIIEHPEGDFVRYADYIQELTIERAECEFWRLRAKRERERNANTIT